ncbi:MAG: hypothetical protein V4707_06085 [Pseudomonadota bacterium]
MAVALAIQTVAILIWWLVAKLAFGIVLSGPLFLAGVTAIGTIILAAMSKWVPPLPFKGKAPEEVAAEAFFQAKDVRSDDNRFEDDLQP